MEPANNYTVSNEVEEPTGQTRSLNVTRETDPVDKNDLKSIISETLDIPNDDSWTITDTDDNLAMIHYDLSKADLYFYGKCRGIVVDVDRRLMVADSYGYTPAATSDAIVPDETGVMTLLDRTGVSHQIDLNDPQLKMGYGIEGVLIRVFKWDGKVYFCSHRRFDISKSRWGDSLPFLTIYEILGGPAGEELFPKDQLFSPYVYFFLAEHPGLLHVAKNQVGGGFLFYLGHRTMWSVDPKDSPFRMENENGDPILYSGQSVRDWKNDLRTNIGFVDPTLYLPPTRSTIPSFEESEEQLRTNSRPEIIALPNLSVPQANTLLRFGYYGQYDDRLVDYRLRTGEFVVVYKSDGSLVRVESGAYRWRANIADDNPNRRHRFYQLSDAARTLDFTEESITENEKIRRLKRFRELFPPMKKWNIEDIKSQLNDTPILVWDMQDNSFDPTKRSGINTFKGRVYNIWACLFMASPINRQAEIVEYYDEYFRDRDLVIDWIAELNDEDYVAGAEEPYDKFVKTIVNVIEAVNRETEREISNRTFTPNSKNFKQTFKEILISHIHHLPGSTLYRLVVSMKRARADHDNPDN